MSQQPTIWTVGHSTRPIGEFVDLLHAHGIALLVDVRTIPRSRYNPQFSGDTLAESLREAGLQYRHLSELGGLRKPKKDSLNDGWRNASFRGYADYMQTEEFLNALEELVAEGRSQPTAIMCAEAVPWRCHRSLIADALVSRGWNTGHIMSPEQATLHVLTSFAHLEAGILTYPKPVDPPSLF
ncbi:DNA repair protein [Nitrospira sp. SCGC AG-212-E16]|nr:DNA repair protein [Nitrospira sp. SCGC AG-212-E16]